MKKVMLVLCVIHNTPLRRYVRHYKWHGIIITTVYCKRSIRLILIVRLKNLIVWKINAFIALVIAINYQPYYLAVMLSNGVKLTRYYT